MQRWSVALAALGGVIWSPKLSNAVAKATGAVKPVQVSVDVRHLVSADPEQLFSAAREEAALNIVIRNQPAGRVTLVSVDDLTNPLTAVQPDGSVVVVDAPSVLPAMRVSSSRPARRSNPGRCNRRHQAQGGRPR